MSPKATWWWDRSTRTTEDEAAVADLRMKMERILSQLESSIEEMRYVLEEEEGESESGGNGNGSGHDEGSTPA